MEGNQGKQNRSRLNLSFRGAKLIIRNKNKHHQSSTESPNAKSIYHSIIYK